TRALRLALRLLRAGGLIVASYLGEVREENGALVLEHVDDHGGPRPYEERNEGPARGERGGAGHRSAAAERPADPVWSRDADEGPAAERGGAPGDVQVRGGVVAR